MTEPVHRCSFCGGPNERWPQAYCHDCHRDYQRDWRKIQKARKAEVEAQVAAVRAAVNP